MSAVQTGRGMARAKGELTAEDIEDLLARGEFFWLDLDTPDDEDFRLLRDVFGFHPLAVEDSEHFGQRPKLEEYGDHVFLVVYGAAADADEPLVEVHFFYSERSLVTVHRTEWPQLADLQRRYREHGFERATPSFLLYRIADGLVDTFFPLLEHLDDRIDELGNAIFVEADERQLQEIFQMKRSLVRLRKAVSPQRDTFASLAGSAAELPGMSPEEERYFRDVYDHLLRISELIDNVRDLLTSSLDVYLSTVSNRLNSVMKQLAVIATIFLPLSWLTSFFGQNFGWLVARIGGWGTFVAVGLGTQLLMLVTLLVMFRRRAWF